MAVSDLKRQVMQRLEGLAKKRLRRIALPEAGRDARLLAAAIEVARLGAAAPVLVGPRAEIVSLAAQQRLDISGLAIFDPREDDGTFARAYQERRASKEKLSEEEARTLLVRPEYFAALGVSRGEFDGCVCGAVMTSGEVVRVHVRCIGLKTCINTLSSFFVMIIPASAPVGERILLFADCAVVVEPTVEQLTDIAIAACDLGAPLIGIQPRVAMLSFSTRASAQHHTVTKMREAARLLKQRRPDLPCDGELQLDAALVPDIAKRKAPDSPLAGDANVLIFPDLDAGNIGYKLVQRLGHADVIGPVLAGLARPACDLSRGSSVQDIVDTIIITAAQANL